MITRARSLVLEDSVPSEGLRCTRLYNGPPEWSVWELPGYGPTVCSWDCDHGMQSSLRRRYLALQYSAFPWKRNRIFVLGLAKSRQSPS
jgi:hypothetical protein